MEDPPLLRERLVFEDVLFHASHQLEEEGPTYLGLVLLQTRRHARDLADLTEDEAQRLGPLLSRLSRAVETCTGAAWTYCYSFLEGYRHVHFLVTARYSGLPKEYVRLDVDEWPDAPRGGREQVAELSRQLRKTMQAPP